MSTYFSTLAQLCQKEGLLNGFGLSKRPEQNKWIKLGTSGAASLRYQTSGEDRILYSAQQSECSEDAAASLCEGDSLANTYETMVWNQKKVTVKGITISSDNICTVERAAAFLTGESFALLKEKIVNLINKVDREVFNELNANYIKDSVSGVAYIILGGISQDGMPWANTSWNAKTSAWEAQEFEGSTDFQWVAGQDAAEFNLRAGVSEGQAGYIHQSRNVEAGKAYQVKMGSYYFMQKATVKAGFYGNNMVLSLEQVFNALNESEYQVMDSYAYQVRDAETGIVITLSIKKTKGDCDTVGGDSWTITPVVFYQLLVPKMDGGCGVPAPHLYRYNICGIPDPVCQSSTPAYAAPRLCLNTGAVVGCAQAVYGSLVAISGGSVSGSGAVLSPYGADVSTVLGQAVAINSALSGVVGGGSVFINSAGALEYSGSKLLTGVSYSITLACGGTLAFTLNDCAGVPQPNNVVLPSLAIKIASSIFTQDGQGNNDNVLAIKIGGKPDITINKPMADITGIQADIDAYFLAQGAIGGITYQYLDAVSGSQATANFISATNLNVLSVDLEINGVSPSVITFS